MMWKGRFDCSSHSVTTACSLAEILLSRSRDTITDTEGSNTGRNRQIIPNTFFRSPSSLEVWIGQISKLGEGKCWN